MRSCLPAALVVACASVSVDARGSSRVTHPIALDTNTGCLLYDVPHNEDEDCAYLENFWGISHEDFLSWNPSVKEDCSGITVGNSYCIDYPPSKPPRPTILARRAEEPEKTGSPKPSPTQDGLIDSCISFYKAAKGDNCDAIARKYGTFTVEKFISWNPAVGADCLGLWAETYYCVGIPGTPGSPTKTAEVPSTTTIESGISTPTPTQPGMVPNCDRFYLVQPGEGCWAIAQKHGISEDQLSIWNPSIGGDCSGLWADVYVCVGTIGFTPPVQIACHTSSTTKTWGGNQIYALMSSTLWCEENVSPNGSGPFTGGQSKKGCFNAELGVNKYQFEIVNQKAGSQTLAPYRCRELMQLPIDVCDRGGVITTDGWEVRASVIAGRC